jgi:hypothetical protein
MNLSLAASALAFWMWAAAGAAAAASGATPVLEYHGDTERSGLFVVPALTAERARAVHLDLGFHAEFPGHVYAQPLYWTSPRSGTGILVVATEDDLVLALDAQTGKELWRRSLGQPAPRSALSCGNIDPLGITGTPVIDRDGQAVYLAAVTLDEAGVHHRIFGLSLADGAILPGWPVDVAKALESRQQSFEPRDQNQRGALLLLNHRLFVPFGGHFGDCGDYHGWVLGLPLDHPDAILSWETRARGGGIWAPGGISSDGHDLFATTGNTFRAAEWSDGEAVFRLAPDLHRSDAPQDVFAPKEWHALDERDLDLGGSDPLLLPAMAGTPPLLLALGKDRRAYLLDRGNLGGIGGGLVVAPVSMTGIRTAPAAYPVEDSVLVAFDGSGVDCPVKREGNGLIVLKIAPGTPPAMTTAWCGALRGRGAPIVTTTDGRANPIVWIVGAEGDNRLHGFKGDTGEPLAGGESGDALAGLRHFQTLIAAGERLYVAADGRVYAFAF